MIRFTAFGGLLMLALVQTGCCCVRCCGPDQGCGRTYWGAYCEDPARCEPCDRCGNWTGHGCGNCGSGGGCASIFPWERCRQRRLGLFHDLFAGSCLGGSCTSGCCEPACEATCEATCEPTCETTCEPTCETGCGVTGCTSCGGHNAAMDAAVSVPFPASTAKNVSYRKSSMLASSGAHTKPCNCNH